MEQGRVPPSFEAFFKAYLLQHAQAMSALVAMQRQQLALTEELLHAVGARQGEMVQRKRPGRAAQADGRVTRAQAEREVGRALFGLLFPGAFD